MALRNRAKPRAMGTIRAGFAGVALVAAFAASAAAMVAVAVILVRPGWDRELLASGVYMLRLENANGRPLAAGRVTVAR